MNHPELKTASIVLMTLLFIWATVWVCTSIIQLRKETHRKLYWKTHLIWSAVNISIAVYSLYNTWLIESFTKERMSSLITVVSLNVVLDIIYLIAGFMLKASKQNGRKEIGRAVIIQSIFLLVLDTVIVTTFVLAIGFYYSE